MGRGVASAVVLVLCVGVLWKTTVGSVGDAMLLDTLNNHNNNNESNSGSGGGGVYWATTAAEAQEFDEGGFSSMEAMLQWAIGNSDPAKLKKTAQDVHTLSPNDLENRQLQLQELMEQLKTPSDAQLMQTAIADWKNSSLSLADRHHALEEILVLVEVIDNANNLHKFGGLAMVIQELINSDQEIRITCAWILGKASQNNPVVQNQILELGALAKLMKMAKSSCVEESTKALYAVSALIRNNRDGQELFYAEGGDSLLQGIMSNSSVDIRLRKKSAFLVADLADSQLQSNNNAGPPLLCNRFFLKSVVDLTASTDLDLQEKALMAIKSLLQLSTTDALDLRDFCHLDRVLERMREEFEQLMTVEYQKDFVQDMELLRRQVESIYHRKLDKVTRVPT